jgi:4-hydroxy-4-methyl-2-oxoglutarate aldolase
MPGLVVRRVVPRPDPALVAQFDGASTGHLGDALGRSAALGPAVKPIVTAGPWCGVALTVIAPPADNLVVWKALSLAVPGDVIVIATAGHINHSIWGEMTGMVAARSGVVAVVTDGAVRDVTGLREVGVPVYAAAVTPNSPEKHGPGQVNTPICCAGQVVCPGDIVVGDTDGVVVVPLRDAEAAVQRLLQVREYEERRLAEIEAGAGLPAWVDQLFRDLGGVEE